MTNFWSRRQFSCIYWKQHNKDCQILMYALREDVKETAIAQACMAMPTKSHSYTHAKSNMSTC